MTGWRDVDGPDGEAMAFNEANLARVLRFPWFRTGVYLAYAEAMRGEEARIKN